jgi:hypothetical protein
MMKLRPKMLEPGKGAWGGLETWIPAIVVVVAVVLHLIDLIAVEWAAIPTAAALLYTMGEPVAYRVFRKGQFPGWAKAAAVLLVAGALAWAVVAAVYWSLPGTIVAEGDLAAEGDKLALRPEAPGELRDYLLEVTVDKLPELDKPLNFPYRLRVGREDVRGRFGKDFVRRRFRGGSGKTLEERRRDLHRLRIALTAKDEIRLESLTRKPVADDVDEEEAQEAVLEAPVHVLLQEAPFTRLTMGLVSGPLALAAAVVEAFEDRSRKERSRLTMLVAGILGAVIYFLVAVTPDNLLLGVLGSAIAGLGGAVAGFVLALLVAKVLRRG